ncbi:MRG1 isoform X1 [Olea europaea subsp. europaea]|uniref:MRG1 isoform X1 n=1 Tax=Olea europaea subsp. europaea TaxID=158383 RepID=A0A8S0TCC5_OLEEU|nr:MRG1 isoform X1 [Olea europaea subsp. europaea]
MAGVEVPEEAGMIEGVEGGTGVLEGETGRPEGVTEEIAEGTLEVVVEGVAEDERTPEMTNDDVVFVSEGATEDEPGSDGENSSGNVPESNSECIFVSGEKVLAYHGPRIYEAKVQKVEFRKNEWKYHVHYLGWNKNWDEWVGMDRLMKHTEENVLKQQALDKKAGVDKNAKSWRSSQVKPKSSSDSKLDNEETKNNVSKGKKRKADSGIEKNNSGAEKLLKIQIPSTLKKQLVDDWEFITQQNKLVRLPRSPNVEDIIAKYLDYRSKKDGTKIDAVGEILKGLRCYFNKALPVVLLYKKEREQYNEAVSENVTPSNIYGAEHLLRLFVKLPELLAYVKIDEETLIRMQQKLHEFLKFLQKNESTFFLATYDDPKIMGGSGKGKDN